MGERRRVGGPDDQTDLTTAGDAGALADRRVDLRVPHAAACARRSSHAYAGTVQCRQSGGHRQAAPGTGL